MSEEISVSGNQDTGFSVIQTRLNTNEILQKIEMYLRGSVIVAEQVQGKIVYSRKSIGVAKANDIGVQSILSWISLLINPSVVQGNFKSERSGHCQKYEDFCCDFQVDLGCYLMQNRHLFGISLSEYNGMINSIMNLVRPFMTRLIDNKERESYIETTKHTEQTVVQPEKRGMFS